MLKNKIFKTVKKKEKGEIFFTPNAAFKTIITQGWQNKI